MKLRFGVAPVLVLTVVGCRAPEKPKPPPNPPTITSFTVDQSSIRRGQPVTFNFTVERAKTVELIDQDGTALATSLNELSGVGSAQSTPARSSFYVLRAAGEGGRDSAFVQVAVDEGLQSVFLAVVPQRIRPGERVDLIWAASGGRNVQLRSGNRTISTLETGTTFETPMNSVTYTLSAERADGVVSTQTATVTVLPVVREFAATPPAARPGEKIVLSWKTSGADSLVLEEATFGRLVFLAQAAQVADGSFEFVVPAFFADAGAFDSGVSSADAGAFDGGPTDGGLTDAGFADAGVVDGGSGPGTRPSSVSVRDGFPLRFTLTAKSSLPDQEVQRTVNGRVGRGPSIDVFDVPPFGTRGETVNVSWQTTGAAQITLLANGLPVYSPPQGVDTSGSFRLSPFAADTSFTLVAKDFSGASTQLTRLVKPVAAPRIVSFTAPTSSQSATMKVNVSWVTQDASFLLLRLKDGPAFFREDAMVSVNSGSRQFTVPKKGTYVLEAYNAAGQRAVAERTIDVLAPVIISTTPELLARGEITTLAWDVGLINPNDMLGLWDSQPPRLVQNSNSFDELTMLETSRTLFFADRDNGVATLSLPNGFAFPFVTRLARRLTVSTNGFVALEANAPSLPANADLSDVAYAGPPLLAPFWDDLDLSAEGSVLWNLDESIYPRRLTIQWNKVRRVGVVGSELTFQVQLFETGEFLFAWKTLSGPGADGAEATIGAIDAVDAFHAQVAFNSPSSAELVPNSERVFFSGNPQPNQSRSVRMRATSRLGFVLETPTEFIPVSATVRAFGPGDVTVSEAMPAPLSSVDAGKWVELRNPDSSPIDLSGLRLEAASSMTNSFFLPPGTTLDGGAFLVLGQSTLGERNGDAGVQIAWPPGSIQLSTPDTIRLVVPTPTADGGATVVVGQLGWGNITTFFGDGGVAPDGGITIGVSTQPLDSNVILRTGAQCEAANRPRRSTYGPPTQLGTPGRPNERCFEYALSSVPFAFDDISGRGSALGFDDNDEGEAILRLERPFPLFDRTVSRVFVNTNGFISLVSASTAVAFVNPIVPGSAPEYAGAIAPFWDDLEIPLTRANAAGYALRLSDRTIVQWSHVATFFGSEDFTFQVHLIDNGTVEFHYEDMVSASSTNRGNGNGATRWIERTDGNAAIASGVNAPTLVPRSAVRFTPIDLLESP
jgi:hypothetical protein